MAKRGKPTGNKRQRERDKRRKREDKEARRQWRKDMRARGLDPDAVDEDGNPLPSDHDAFLDADPQLQEDLDPNSRADETT